MKRPKIDGNPEHCLQYFLELEKYTTQTEQDIKDLMSSVNYLTDQNRKLRETINRLEQEKQDKTEIINMQTTIITKLETSLEEASDKIKKLKEDLENEKEEYSLLLKKLNKEYYK